MTKFKPARRLSQPPLEVGQLWRMAEANLQVVRVGKLLVHYKVGKPNAVRVPSSCSGLKTIEKYLKTNKAVLDLVKLEGSRLAGFPQPFKISKPTQKAAR
jgi:hypothetical protein